MSNFKSTIPLSLSRKLVFYSLGAGAVSVAATAHADPVVTPVNQSGPGFYFSLQNTVAPSSTNAGGASAGDQFEVTNNGYKKGCAAGVNATTNELETMTRLGGSNGTTSTVYALELGVGTTIGPGTFSQKGELNNYYAGSGSNKGDWKAPTEGFLALEFVDSNGQTDYGFADVTVTTYQPTGTEITLNGYAYDPTGASITTFSVPEPGTTTALLVAGAAGVAALRLRRRSGATVEV